jgi:hypothetical protein
MKMSGFETESATRELLIPRQIEELQASLERLEKAIVSLSSRLAKVSSPTPKSEQKDVPVPAFPCDYAEVLASQSRFACRLCDIVTSLENSLEL